MTEPAIRTDEELGVDVRALRQRLLDAGFRPSGHTGELVRTLDDGDALFVRTGYTMGSYRVSAFRRSNGISGHHVGHCYVDVQGRTSRAAILELEAELVGWDGSAWPPAARMVPSPEARH